MGLLEKKGTLRTAIPTSFVFIMVVISVHVGHVLLYLDHSVISQLHSNTNASATLMYSVQRLIFVKTKMIALALECILIVVTFTPTRAAAQNKAPLGFQLMCLKKPEACRGGCEPSVTASDEVMATLRRINESVNNTLAPPNDEADIWNAEAATSGDCEDYVLAKRRALIAAGFPASSLQLANAKSETGEGQTFLVVNANRGKFVLDNLRDLVLPLSQTGYHLVSMQT